GRTSCACLARQQAIRVDRDVPRHWQPTPEIDPAEYRSPPLDCDVVMKGGITSGVVYPGAVLELAKRYRFRSIGGASAGGIAAAVVILVMGLAADVFRAVLALGANDFGLCHLGPSAGTPEAPALTEWLHERLQSISGKGGTGPLTFAHLWGVPSLPAEPA